jgi:hypothetical protein
MKDYARVILAIALVAGGIFIMKDHFFRYISRVLNIAFQEAISLGMLMLTIVMLIVMFLTIWANNKASLEQINAIKLATLEHIGAIKNSTQAYIDNFKDEERRRKDALLSALILEYTENIRWVNDTIGKEKELTDEGKDGKVALAVFSDEAYQANLQNATIDNPTLLDKIVQLYSAFKLFQNFLDTANKPFISSASRAKTLGNLIRQMKENLDNIMALREEIINYRRLK